MEMSFSPRIWSGSTSCATFRTISLVASSSDARIPWISNTSHRRYCITFSISHSFSLTFLSKSVRWRNFWFSFRSSLFSFFNSLIDLIAWWKFDLIKSWLFLISSISCLNNLKCLSIRSVSRSDCCRRQRSIRSSRFSPRFVGDAILLLPLVFLAQ